MNSGAGLPLFEAQDPFFEITVPLHYFHPAELYALVRYPVFGVLLFSIPLWIALYPAFHWRRVPRTIGLLFYGTWAVLVLRFAFLFVTERRIIFSADFPYLPFTAEAFALLEAGTALALVHGWMAMIGRGRIARRTLPAGVSILAALALASFLAAQYQAGPAVSWSLHVFAALLFFTFDRVSDGISEKTDPDLRDARALIPSLRTAARGFLVAEVFYLAAPYLEHDFLLWIGHLVWATGTMGVLLAALRLGALPLETADARVELREKENRTMLDLFELISERVSSANDAREVAWLTAEAAVKVTGGEAAAFWLWNEKKGAYEASAVFGRFPPLRAAKPGTHLDDVIGKTRTERFSAGKTWAGAVVESRKSLRLDSLDKEGHPLVEQSEGVPLKSIVAAPVVDGDTVLGVVAAINKENLYSRFSESDQALLQVLAKQAVLAQRHFQLIQQGIQKKVGDRDLSIAGNIQQGLLPAGGIKNDEFEYHGFSYAAKGVGGDYFDVREFGEGRYGVIMSDVAGKGIPASLVMVMISTVFRTWAASERSTNEVAAKINEALCGSISQDRYATFFYTLVDTRTKTIRFCNAAHGPLVLFRPSTGAFELLDTPGMPLGITAEGEYEEREAPIQAGDMLILYTDGITEAMNTSRDQYGMDRLQAMVREHQHLSIQELTTVIYGDITKFVGEEPKHDDQTLVIVRVP